MLLCKGVNSWAAGIAGLGRAHFTVIDRMQKGLAVVQK
jgi:hypothetical protein